MKRLLLLLVLARTVYGDDDLLWRASVATFAAANAADAISSWGGYELNPVLGRGPFGPRQTMVKAGIAAGVVVTEWRWMRRHRRAAAIANFVASGILAGVAARNWRVR
jgi:hypothetical protein